MIATIYKALSNKPEVAELPAGVSIKEALPQFDTERAVIFVNNKPQDENYILRKEDVVFIRLAPGAVSSTILAGIAIGVAVLAVGGAIYAGIQSYSAKKEAEAASEALEKLKAQTNSSIDNRPFLRGASNTAATSNTQPYICGRHLLTPYTLSDAFYEIEGDDGENQYVNVILEGGFNKQVIRKLGTDDIDLLTLEGDEPQEGTFDTNGSATFANGKVEIAQDGELLEGIPALNYKVVSTTCNEEVPRTSDINDEDSDVEDYIFSLDSNAMDVTVCVSFTSGLYAYDDDGDKLETSVTITPQYSLDGGSSWKDFTFDNNGTATNTFKRSISSKELRYAAKKEFSLSDYSELYGNGQSVIQCRLRSSGANDSQICNSCYILYYQSVCFDPNTSSSPAGVLDDGGAAGLVKCLVLNDRERAKSTLIGVRLKATSSNEDKLSKIFVITSGVARTWDGEKWSEEKTATRNPAAWALEILTSDTHALSKYEDEEIDLESFGEWFEFCEENEFYFDYVISQKTKKETVLGYAADCACACLYTDIYGRKAIAIDRPQENAVAVYNPQNIISAENSREFARRTDCVRVTFTNSKDDLYEEDTYAVMREENGEALELTEDSVITDLTTSGITTYEHVVKYARRMLAIEILRPKTTTIEVGNEGIYLTPYSKILLQDDSLKIGTGHAVIEGVVWEGGVAKTLLLKNPVTIEEGKSYGAIAQCFTAAGEPRHLSLKVAGEVGVVSELELLTEITSGDDVIPEGGEVLSFGELDDSGEFEKVATPYMVASISRADQGFSLELVNYDEAIYDSGSIPDYRSNITQKPASSSAEIPDDFISRDELYEAITAVTATVVEGTSRNVGAPDTPYNVTALAEKDGISLSCSLGTAGLKNDIATVTFEVTKADGTAKEIEVSGASASYSFDRASDGYPESDELAQWRVRAKALNIYGQESEYSAAASLSLEGYLGWLCPVLALQSVQAKQDGIYAEWQAESSLTFGDIRYNFALYYNGEAIKEAAGILLSSYSYLFDRSSGKDGYPETHSVLAQLEEAGEEAKGRDISLYSVKIEGYTLQAAGHVEQASSAVSTDYYGTWVPAEVSSVTAQAEKDYVEISVSVYPSASNWGTPYSYIMQLSKDGGQSWEETESASSFYSYYFDRDEDGYPEADELQSWRARAKAVSSAGNRSARWGGGTSGVAVSTSSYGTWAVSSPDVNVTVSGRSVTLSISQPALASQRERYGTFYNRLQIQKPSESSAWLKPAQNLDPYADEANWQDGEGYVTVEGVYTQTMPLTGQTLQDVEVEGEIVQQSSPEATLYRFKIEAFSEAGEAEAVEVNATALATGIQDIVAGSVTQDKISTPSLSAITANMGVITSGGFTGSELNYWFLSTIQGMSSYGFNDGYEGAFRVGGEEEYLIVEPQVESGKVTGYKMRFKAGVFEITTEATTINGEIIVQASEDSLDRTRITPTGTYFEHRTSSGSEDWEAAAQVRVDGIRTGSVTSGGSLVLSNLDLASRRLAGHDIGRPYLSEKARVWHFDTDFLDQNQAEGLAIFGSAELADEESYPDSNIDFSPAILAVAPYAEDAKVAYGQFAAEIGLEASNAFTADFWAKYRWNEGQTLLDISNEAEGARLVVENGECYYNDYTEGRDEAPFNAEILQAGDVVVWNEPEESAGPAIVHYSSLGQSESASLESLGVDFGSGEWLHMAAVFSESSISVFLGDSQVSFARYATAATAITVSLNEAASTFLLDELYLDTGAAESFEEFKEGTEKRIPWGALDHSKKSFVLDADGLATNIFDTEEFKAAVRAVINGG